MQTLSSKPVPRVERLGYATTEQGSTAIGGLTFGTLLAAVEILLFDWRASTTVVGGLLGACVWGAAMYFWSTSDLVPRGRLEDAPASIEVEPGGIDLSSRLWLIGVGAALLPFAWLADRLDVGPLLVPGQPWGYAAAALVWLVRIRRWEQANGRRVVYDPGAGTPRPYAGPPL